MNKMIYIAGPYRAEPRPLINGNIRIAEQYGQLAAEAGWYPLVPHLSMAHWDHTTKLGDEFFLAATTEMMRRCDAIFVCPGHEQSSGTLAEIEEATRLGKPVYYNIDDLITGVATTWPAA